MHLVRLMLERHSIHGAHSTWFFLDRQERVNIRSLGGQAKVFGTVICVGGAMLMTFYKGPALKFLSPGSEGHLFTNNSKAYNLVLGSILVFGSIVVMAACLSFQVTFIIISHHVC
jgi:hypothetical protein